MDITEDDGNAYGQYYEYNGGNTAVIEGKDRLTFESKTQKSTVNILSNHSFEADSGYTFSDAGETAEGSSGGYALDPVYIGARSYRLTRPGDSQSAEHIGYTTVTLEANKEYTLSVYAYTSYMESNGGGASVYVRGLEQEYESEVLKTSSDKWQRIWVTFTPSTTGQYEVGMRLKGAVSNVYFDCIQLEKGSC